MLAAGLSAWITYALPTAQVESWGWRVAFLFGLLIGPIGVYIRRHTPETPEFLTTNGTKTTKNEKKEKPSWLFSQ